MTVTSFDPNVPVTLTEEALRHFEKALHGQDNKLVRLSVQTNGCSGYGYALSLSEDCQAEDTVIQVNDNVTLAIAADAIDILRGTEIDIVTQGVNRVIKYNNPNASAECGCGESFSLN